MSRVEAALPGLGAIPEARRERPDDLAGRQVPPSEHRGWLARARPRRLPGSRGPPDTMTIQPWGVLTAGQAGGYPSQRQSMPGTQALWQGQQRLTADGMGDEAMPAGNERELND